MHKYNLRNIREMMYNSYEHMQKIFHRSDNVNWGKLIRAKMNMVEITTRFKQYHFMILCFSRFSNGLIFEKSL